MNSEDLRDKPAEPNAAPRKRERVRGPSTYYLQDRPVLVPVVTLLLGGLCVYSTVFSTLLRDTLIGTGANRSVSDTFYTATSWALAFVLGLMVIALVYLMVHFADVGIKRIRRRPAVCPRCGTTEVRGTMPFIHEPIEGTEWENVTCPNCDTTWHGRR